MNERFTGTVEPFAAVDVRTLADWITAIPFTDWPQQGPLNGQARPAMVTDLAWNGFGLMTESLISRLMQRFHGCTSKRLMLSAVLPGHWIDAHTDEQNHTWLCRIHVPLTSNERALFFCGGEWHWLKVGWAYMVNTIREHAIANDGETARIHFMFDVMEG